MRSITECEVCTRTEGSGAGGRGKGLVASLLPPSRLATTRPCVGASGPEGVRRRPGTARPDAGPALGQHRAAARQARRRTACWWCFHRI
ncbi:hypothetical protein E2C01_004104 [Portunus trituberculatus]|uniref:Uncharacterized protein n=1 Tax=Portunus trituberculatus TaxID=210409 RepID=A0A5B7CQP1_PORTR|nr:hypothetical protein [Portunus trituberculatus]